MLCSVLISVTIKNVRGNCNDVVKLNNKLTYLQFSSFYFEVRNNFKASK